MDPKNERIAQGSKDISRLLDKWGYGDLGSHLRPQKQAEIMRWLYNFEPSELDDAFLLMDKIQYKDERTIRDVILNLSKELVNILGEDLKRTLFFPAWPLIKLKWMSAPLRLPERFRPRGGSVLSLET